MRLSGRHPRRSDGRGPARHPHAEGPAGRAGLEPLGRLRAQSGQALPIVIGFLIVFSIGVVTVAELSGAVGRDSARENSHDAALAAAESGTATALSVLSNATRPLDPATLPSSASPEVDGVDGGSVSWYGTLSGDTWTIRAKASIRNPAGGGDIVRSAQLQARVGSTAVNPAWSAAFANSSGCLNVTGSAEIRQPVYTRGSLCLDNAALVTGDSVDAEGTVQTLLSSSVGTSGSPIAGLHAAGGCRYGSIGSFVTPCGAGEHVYASSQDQLPAGLTKPPLDLDYWYANAAPGPSRACTTGSFPGGFDTDGTMNRSLPDVDLFASDYDCTVVASGTQVGRIAYTAGSPGTMVVDGTVFVDGNIVMSGAHDVRYSGRGTIYASGKIDLEGSERICAAWAAGCDAASWQPSTDMLVLVAGSSTDAPGFVVGGNAAFQGGVYAAGDYTETGSAQVQGPKVAEAMTLAAGIEPAYPAYTYLPPGAPMEKPVVTVNSWQ